MAFPPRGILRTAASVLARNRMRKGSRRRARKPTLSGEMLGEPAGVVLLPHFLRLEPGEVLVQEHEEVDELTSDRRASQQLGQLGQLSEPAGVPRRPVGVLAVGDAVDDVVGLRGLVQEPRDVLDLHVRPPCRGRIAARTVQCGVYAEQPDGVTPGAATRGGRGPGRGRAVPTGTPPEVSPQSPSPSAALAVRAPLAEAAATTGWSPPGARRSSVVVG